MNKTKQQLIQHLTRAGASQSGSDLLLAAWIMLGRQQSAIALEIVLTGLIANGHYDQWSVDEIFTVLKNF